jgi:hypothetical protein
VQNGSKYWASLPIETHPSPEILSLSVL